MWENLLDFLRSHDLLQRPLQLGSGEDPCEGLELRADDLTPLGLEVVRQGFTKWVSGLDRGKSPTDVKVLQKAYDKLSGAAE